MMRFGLVLNMPAEQGKSDAQVLREHLAMGDLAEPLGFDSLFALEHHFSDFLLSPAPLQILAYYAGRTRRIELGTAVIVLPWHQPIQVAEQIALLDILCDGRCVFAFGRGRSDLEYSGFGINFAESQSRFAEAAEIVVRGLGNETIEYQGEFHQIPLLSVRPRPISTPETRFYAAVTSDESVRIAARLGFGLLVATTKPWAKLATEVSRFRNAATVAGHAPKAPIVLSSISVARSRRHAEDRAFEYMAREEALAAAHYRVSGNAPTATASVGPVEQMAPSVARDSSATYLRQQLVGTPDDCVQQISELMRAIGSDHLLLEFSFGGMPKQEIIDNITTFAQEVMPRLRQPQSKCGFGQATRE